MSAFCHRHHLVWYGCGGSDSQSHSLEPHYIIRVYDSDRNTTGNMHIRLECEGSLFGLERNKGQKNKFKCESYFVSVRIGVPDNRRGQR